MKTILLTLIIAVTTSSANASFNRFWVGHIKKDITAAQFLNGLNSTFFRDTINLGKGKGLLSYQPYITAMSANLPDEIALVVYESEEKYRAIRNTPEGERYSAAHWDFFEKDLSKSTVTVPFEGKFEMNGAYELNPGSDTWQKGHTIVSIYELNTKVLGTLAKKFIERKKVKGIRNAVILLSGDLLIEYVSVSNPDIRPEALGKIIERHSLPSASLQNLRKPVGTEEGVNFLF